MGPDRMRLSDPQLEAMIESSFPDSSAQDVENFMSSIQKFARQAAPVVQQLAPVAAKGAMSGATVGGPWGAAIGGLGAVAGSLISGGAKRPARGRAPVPSAQPLQMAPAPVAAPPAAPGGGALAGAGVVAGAGVNSAAAAQLITLLSRPETMQALLALLLGQAGRTSIPVGEHQIPATAFADALSELASEAGGSARTSGYWFDQHGEPRCDLANARSRAGLVWNDVAEAAEAAEAEESESESEGESMEFEEAFDADALDSFEAALAGEHFDD